jgi:tRNA-specific 2-thiouridylase
MTKTAVLLSGGVDSLVTAGILKKQGIPIFGIHFYTGYESADDKCAEAGLQSDASDNSSHHAALERADFLRQQLDIPIEVLDVRSAFRSRVVEYFIQSYQAGRTPNPCVICNPMIKFGACLSLAREMGASHLATGHYAQIREDRQAKCHLYRAKDLNKDQSYFLARMNQAMLARALFPLGPYTKTETKSLARQLGLTPVNPLESQDVCFIPNSSYAEFLEKQPSFKPAEGPIETIDGDVIGRHQGLHRYTIGQRRGINIPAAEPYYVIRMDASQNRLVVGPKSAVFEDTCNVFNIQWINGSPPQNVHVDTRIRYRHRAAPSRLTLINNTKAQIHFETPQSAVTPGQAAVFYLRDEVLGGGWIA